MTTTTARLRHCAFAPSERAVVAGIWRRAWASAHPDIRTVEPIAHWHQRVHAEFNPPHEVWLAEREGQALGFMALHPRRRYLAQLYVDTQVHRQGLGRLLLDEACRRMPRGWHLHVALANGGAVRFYEHYGLVAGTIDRHPVSHVERIEYHWRPDP